MIVSTPAARQKAAGWGIPIGLALVLFVAGFLQLDRYGVTWDEALGDLFFGQRYLSYFTSFDARYLDFAGDPYAPDHRPDLRSSLFRTRPWEYWPVANTLAAATSRIAAGWLGIVDPFDGFHLFNLIAGVLFLPLFFRFVAGARGVAAGVASSLTLFLMPRVFADVMTNIKDFPEMIFFSATLILFHRAWERASVAGMGAAGVLWGMALGTKANAWFIAPTVLLFVVLRGFETWRGDRRRMIGALCVFAAVAAAIFVGSWPFLWADLTGRLEMNFRYLVLRATSHDASSGINAWAAVTLTTPPVVLLCSAIGLTHLVRPALKREPFALLVLSWFSVVALRISVGLVNFDGVRHFLELFPPIAILAVEGARWLGAAVSRGAPAFRIAVMLPPLAALVPTIALHPYQTAYWNAFAGGLAGAQERRIAQATDYWGSSYREGIAWLNVNAERGAIVVVPIAGHIVRLVGPEWLRPDLRYVDYPRGGGEAAGRRRLEETKRAAARIPLYVMFITRDDWSTELDRDARARLQPVREWRVEGAPILQIYRYRP